MKLKANLNQLKYKNSIKMKELNQLKYDAITKYSLKIKSKGIQIPKSHPWHKQKHYDTDEFESKMKQLSESIDKMEKRILVISCEQLSLLHLKNRISSEIHFQIEQSHKNSNKTSKLYNRSLYSCWLFVVEIEHALQDKSKISFIKDTTENMSRLGFNTCNTTRFAIRQHYSNEILEKRKILANLTQYEIPEIQSRLK